MPVNLIAAIVVVLSLAVLARRAIGEALRETGMGVVRYFREAGWLHPLALAAIVTAGALLRLHFLSAPMRWDESYSFLAYGSTSVGHLTGTYDSVNNHVFSNLLMHISVSLAGDGYKVIRAPVFFAGVLLPLVAYVAALRIYGRPAALVAAALVAASPELVDYSTNARGYELESLAAVSGLALVPSLLRSSNPAYWGLFCLICGLGFYTVPVFAYPFAVLVGGLALAGLLGQSQDRRRFFVRLAIATAAALGFTALLYGPILGDMLDQTLHLTFGTLSQAIHFGTVGQTLHPALGASGQTEQGLAVFPEAWRLWTSGLLGLATAILVAGFALSMVSVVRRDRGPFPLAVALVLVVAGVIATNSYLTGPDATRVWLPLLPLALIAAVGGLLGWRPVSEALTGQASNALVSIGAVAIAVALALHVSRDDLANHHASSLPSAPSIASAIAPRLTGNDRLDGTVCDGPMQAYALYVQGWAPWFVDSVSRRQAAYGHTYVIVNHLCHETLRLVLAQTAPRTGLKAQGAKKLAAFPDASVYKLGRVSRGQD